MSHFVCGCIALMNGHTMCAVGFFFCWVMSKGDGK